MRSIATTTQTPNDRSNRNPVTTLPTTAKPQTAKEVIAANVKLLIEQLEAGHSEGLTAYLAAMGKFHNYSLGNILEIARQKPDATRVAGLYAWNQLGRKVMKGQKGIRILAPMIGFRRKKDEEAKQCSEAFSAERITASHANLLARLPQDAQANAYEQCWRKDWQDKEPHLLPAKHLSAWIQTNLYLSLADAPFDKEDPTLNSPAGACTTCPRRSGFNTTLFTDVHGDQCLDAACFHTKVNVHIDREIAARPELVQIENGYRSPKEKRPGAVQRGHFREIEQIDNPDAEPVSACEAAKPAIIVYGKRVGTTLTICTDNDCPVHDPRAAARLAEQEKDNPTSVIVPAAEEETEEETAQHEAEYEQRRKEHEAGEERRAEERRQQFEREQQEHEAEQERRDKLRKEREATFERILANAPESFTAAQLRILLRAIVNLDPYTFGDDLAADIDADDENGQRSAEEVLLSAIDNTADDKLTRFALHLALSGHIGIPRENEFDFLTEAENVFAPSQPKKANGRKAKKPAPIKADHAANPKPNKTTTAKKQIAA